MKPFLCIGHRGAAGLEPENTLLSIRRAIELGARGIEIDIHLSRDGVPMVIHDHSLQRTTGVPGYVDAFDYVALEELDAGKGERIPSLDAVLDEIQRLQLRGKGPGILLNIELKGHGTAAVVEGAIVRAVERGFWRFEDFIVSSFRRKELAAVRHPQIRIGVLLARAPLRLLPLVRRLRGETLHIPRRLASLAFLKRVEGVRRVLGRALPVYVYTVNEQAEMIALRERGVDGVFTDFPDRFPHAEEAGETPSQPASPDGGENDVAPAV